MNKTSVTFIGGGNMAASLVGGLIADGWDPDRIQVADTDPQQRERMAARYQVHTTPDNLAAVSDADVVLLAVKPQVMEDVTRALAATVSGSSPLVVSIAAGIRETTLRGWLGENTAIVRAMPNTPALVQSGATALYANKAVSEHQRSLAETILRAVGLVIWIDEESRMDAVTALSGSGPAYFFLFMEALQTAGEDLGLPAKTARLLTLQTALGAARMALESADDAGTLRRHVTSPGGTTERAINSLQESGFERMINRALQAAARRSREIAEEFSDQT